MLFSGNIKNNDFHMQEKKNPKPKTTKTPKPNKKIAKVAHFFLSKFLFVRCDFLVFMQKALPTAVVFVGNMPILLFATTEWQYSLPLQEVGSREIGSRSLRNVFTQPTILSIL